MVSVKKTQLIFELLHLPIRNICSLLEFARSTVYYHKLKSKKRVELSGCEFWETTQGYGFIVRIVIVSIYVFAIKGGCGAGRLHEFFKLLNLDRYAGVSERSILNQIGKVEALILEYNNEQESKIREEVEDVDLILGVDETWFDRMYLVCQELSSGFLFLEAPSKKRDAVTWRNMIIEKVSLVLPGSKILCFVSDRAQALVKLATEFYKVPSVADCFHFKYGINRLICLALAAKLRCSNVKMEKALKSGSSSQIERCSNETLNYQFITEFYIETMGGITDTIHPYYLGNQANSEDRAQKKLLGHISSIEDIVKRCSIRDKKNLISKTKKQVPDAVAIIGIWHSYVEDSLLDLGLPSQTKEWFLKFFLPMTYWEFTIKKTKHKPTKQRLKVELDKVKQTDVDKLLQKEIAVIESRRLKEFAKDLCSKFQRSSSRVEGRNGVLSLANHSQKGFDEDRLKVMTVVHNFDTRGVDGKTPAERLFGKKIKFPSLFECVMSNFDSLPIPRRRM